MMDHNKLIHSTRSIFLILSLTTLIAIVAFAWIGFYEFYVVKNINQLSVALANTPTAITTSEWQLHLQNQLNKSNGMFIILFVAIILLIMVWLLSFFYLRRVKTEKTHEKQLEELLYYDHISKLRNTSSSTEPLPASLINLQHNREEFYSAIQLAIKNNEFILYYQPIVSALNGEIIDVEALIRWQHPTYGILSPPVFLPLCENTGLIIPLGEWIIKAACQQIKTWHELGYRNLNMSINLSTRQLQDTQLLYLISETLTAHKLSASCLKLEITEDSLMKDIEASVKLLRSLRQLGVQLSLDDFGTGYSYLKYLKQLPISHLKIDRSFIHDMATNITSLGIVESVIALGKSLGLVITAEGVENKNQLHLLHAMECDLIQGYLISKPIPANEFTELLKTSNKLAKINQSLLYDANYHFELLTSRHRNQAIDVIATSFSANEPMTHYLGITQEHMLPFATLMVDKAIKDGLSMIALLEDQLVACTIVEDMADPLDITIDIDPRFKIIFSLLDHLGTDFFNERVPDKGHIVHLFITAVDYRHRGHGLSKKINFESIRLAKEKGFDFMCCEFTHAYTKIGTVKNIENSKLLIRSCVYKDFMYEGSKPFENLEGSASAYISGTSARCAVAL